MNSDKTFNTPLVWLGGGLLGAILAYLGFLPTDRAPSPPPQKIAPDVLDSPYPAVKGSASFASSMWEDPFEKLDEEKLAKSIEPCTELKTLISNTHESNQNIMFLVVPVVEKSDASDEVRKFFARFGKGAIICNTTCTNSDTGLGLSKEQKKSA